MVCIWQRDGQSEESNVFQYCVWLQTRRESLTSAFTGCWSLVSSKQRAAATQNLLLTNKQPLYYCEMCSWYHWKVVSPGSTNYTVTYSSCITTRTSYALCLDHSADTRSWYWSVFLLLFSFLICQQHWWYKNQSLSIWSCRVVLTRLLLPEL